MKFYVIYSYDCTQDINPQQYFPPNLEKWERTEDDDDWEYNYMAEEEKDNPPAKKFWLDGHHGKFVATLDKNEFKEFIKETNLRFEDIDTLGSLTGNGWLPAFSFRSPDGMDYWETSGLIGLDAYVSPFPEPVRPPFSVRDLGAGFWPLSKEEIQAFAEHKSMHYWELLKQVFRGRDYA